MGKADIADDQARLEWVQQEAGIDSLQGRDTDHAAILQLIDLLYLLSWIIHSKQWRQRRHQPTTQRSKRQPKVVIQGLSADLVQQVRTHLTGWVFRSKLAISSSLLTLPEVFHEACDSVRSSRRHRRVRAGTGDSAVEVDRRASAHAGRPRTRRS